jgi:hypothetical protein
VLKNKKRKILNNGFSQAVVLFLQGKCRHYPGILLLPNQKNNRPLGLVILYGGAAGYRTPVRAVIAYPSTNIVRLGTYATSNAQSVTQGW